MHLFWIIFIDMIDVKYENDKKFRYLQGHNSN